MEKVQREVSMKTGKKLMAILIMATLLIPQSVYGADILSENVVGAQAVSDESRVSGKQEVRGSALSGVPRTEGAGCGHSAPDPFLRPDDADV